MLKKASVTALGAIVIVSTIAVQARERAATADPVEQSATMEPRFSRVRLSTGVELHIVESGPADGRPVLFLHGFTDSWFSFSRILDGLPSDVRAIVPSQRGHGDSERPACCFALDDFARDAIALLDALGIQRADIVGHSMGSLVAQRVAIEHPARVDRLVLIGSGTTAVTPTIMQFSSAVNSLRDSVPESFARDFQISTVHDPLPQQFLDRVVRESMKVPPRVWRAALDGLITPAAYNDVSRIPANTLIVWGEEDALWPREHQDELLRAIPSARLVTFDRIGHAPHWEDPARFLADLNRFLAREQAFVDGWRVPQ